MVNIRYTVKLKFNVNLGWEFVLDFNLSWGEFEDELGVEGEC